MPKVTIIHEPKRSAYGVPDYKILKNGIAISFIETKNLNDKDLKGEKEKLHKEQFDRYKSALNTIVFTDYLTFHLYENGELTSSANIANIVNQTIVPTDDKKEEAVFLKIVQTLGNASPQKITQAGKLAEIMAAKAKLIATIIGNAMSENKTDEDKNLHDKLSAFQKILVHDMDEKQFADFYAQTIVYGMFIARINDKTPKTFSRLEAAELIPSFNPFLKKIFKNIALAELHSYIVWIVDDLAEIFRVTDMTKVLKNYGKETGRKDPIIHFYEEFLEEYNPKIREEFGVWYTPAQVVHFIVDAVNEILIKEFGIKNGLANNSKIEITDHNGDSKEIHRIQVLDPATGTGTFLAEACHVIHSYYKGQEGLWPEDVIKHLIPRINGFEYLMAPYTMAHLKLATALQLDQNKGKLPERLNIYLTNSLEEEQPETKLDFGTFVSDEANAANALKRETPVMVVMGNPPYNEKSANKGKWIMDLMDDYKQEPGESKKVIRINKRTKQKTFKNTLKERNPKGINNDYCKFIRLGQHFVNRTQEGVLAYITANTFLDTRLFRGMRYDLLKTFDKIYIINLHGSTMRSESTPELKDQCIFDIMQGVSINIFIKKKDKETSSLAQVFYKDIYGSRKLKLDFLAENQLSTVDFQEIVPSAPLYIFRPHDNHLQEVYESGFKIDKLMPNYVQGFKTGKDEISIQFDKELLEELCKDILNNNSHDVITKYSLPDNAVQKIQSIRKEITTSNYNWKNNLCKINYRPFDNRWTIYGKIFMDRHRPEIQKNIINKNNIVLGIGKSGNVMGNSEWSLVSISDMAMDINVIPRGGIYLFPLYIYEGMLQYANFTPDIVKKIESITELFMQDCHDTERSENGFLPIDLIDYIYAVLYSPSYRDTYNDFLQSDFPIIPYPNSADYFFSIAEKGKELRELHLMKTISQQDIIGSSDISRDSC